jgi:hypothetical protein
MRYVLRLFVVTVALSASGEPTLAQTGQTVPPPPPPTLLPTTSTFTSCMVTCDTVAMNCQNACVVVGPAATTTIGGNTGACTLGCSSQQLVCKQACR